MEDVQDEEIPDLVDDDDIGPFDTRIESLPKQAGSLTNESTPFSRNADAGASTSSGSRRRHLSTAPSWSSISVKSFEEITGKKAGVPLHNIAQQDPYKLRCEAAEADADNYHEYWPFDNQRQYILGRWFLLSKTSKGRIEDYCKDIVSEGTGFKNAQEWKDKVHRIPWGIANDDFYSSSFPIKTRMEDRRGPQQVTFFYRDILGVIRFLLGHGPFKDNLTYGPERHYVAGSSGDGDPIRAYGGMHTGDWWWDLQQEPELPDGATIVPLIISTDKTRTRGMWRCGQSM